MYGEPLDGNAGEMFAGHVGKEVPAECSKIRGLLTFYDWTRKCLNNQRRNTSVKVEHSQSGANLGTLDI